ncbi:hypothetical protein EG329_008483 [Mollisiaceae sp. DMI_Dod_QoI]|nr:hypothetical protein EG329_008483 [Helotiales sp. DMI_Dod_QoI]
MKGIRIDSISEITRIQLKATAAALFDLLRLAFQQDSSLTSQPPLESLVRTICANIVEERTSFNVEDIFGWFAKWFRLISHNPTQLARFRESLGQVDAQDWDKFWMLRDKSLLSIFSDQSTASAEAETWHNSPELENSLLLFVMGPRCLALTGTRRALALTPLSAEPGDEIWILFNGRTPYVLRKKEEGYYFVGEMYLHGFMDGELFDRDTEEGIDNVDIM